MILIICTFDDIHVKAVTEKLPVNSFFILYTDLLLVRYSIWMNNASGTIFDKKNNERLEIDQVTKIWHRRTAKPKLSSIRKDKFFSELRIREGLAFLNFLKAGLKHRDWLTGPHPMNYWLSLNLISFVRL